MTDDPEEREWHGLARKFGVPVSELQEQMSYAEFRRHSEDRADFPDPEERSAHLLYVLSILLNEFIGGWCDGKKPLTGKQIAPWVKVDDKPRELGVDEAIAMFFPPSKVKSKPKPVARPNLGRPETEGG